MVGHSSNSWSWRVRVIQVGDWLQDALVQILLATAAVSILVLTLNEILKT